MNRIHVGVVGGSIAGSVVGAALAREGFDVTILERSAGQLQARGSGIALPSDAVRLLRAAGLVDASFEGLAVHHREWRTSDGNSDEGRLVHRQSTVEHTQHWGMLFNQLQSRLGQTRYVRGAEVTAIRKDQDGVAVTCQTGQTLLFDLVVGADGYRSAVRRYVHPSSDLKYAGYPAWRGIVNEADVPHAHRFDGVIHRVGLPHGHASMYMVPGTEGESAPGSRRLNWLIYDASASALESDEGDALPNSISEGRLTSTHLGHLESLATQMPPWYAGIVRSTVAPSMQRIFDLSLPSYVGDRVCLVGDAGNVARPHTARGTTKAILDALCLVNALTSCSTVDEALAHYDDRRLAVNGPLVKYGEQLGRELVLSPPRWGQLSEYEAARVLEQSDDQQALLAPLSTEVSANVDVV